MMNMIEKLISGYPQGDVSPQDFIDHLSIGADGWVNAWVAVGLAVIFGMLVYIIPIYLTEKDKVGPYPLWLHIVYICVALVSFNPWCNMWTAIAPEFFSLEANPWYYIMGLVCLFFSVRGLVQYRRLPAK